MRSREHLYDPPEVGLSTTDDIQRIPRIGLGEDILVVDDNETNRLVLSGMLTHMGFESHCVADGVSALQAVEQRGPQGFAAILMDCYMPRLDGFEATRLIRGREHELDLGRVPIVAVSAAAGAPDRERAETAGMDDFIPKPVIPDFLASVLDRVLHRDGAPSASPPAAAPAIADPTLRRMVQAAYGHEVQRALVDLRRACANGDGPALGDAAHAIKGASASVGAERATHLAGRVEEQARHGTLCDTEGLVATLCAELEEQARRFATEDRGPSGA